MRFGVVLLAAGGSGRMGLPKMLLPWGGTSVIGHQIKVWNELGAGQLAVVCARGDEAMLTELNRLQFPSENRITNEAPQRGMFSSVRCAAQWPDWAEDLSHWTIALGDQPHLRPETLRALLACAARQSSKIVQPRARGHLHHPVLLPKAHFLELGFSEAATLKDFLESRRAAVAGCEVDDPGLEQDMDTPADYEKIRSSTHPVP